MRETIIETCTDGRLLSEAMCVDGLVGPCAHVLAHEGSHIVIEEFAHRVTMFNEKWERQWQIGHEGAELGAFHYPTACAIAKNGNIFVTDRWNHRVQVLGDTGEALFSFGAFGHDDGKLCEPWGISLTDDSCFIADCGNGRIVVFDHNGLFQRSIGVYGNAYDFYESEQFKRNIHYNTWLKAVQRLNTLETQFFDFGYEIGDFDYPEEITRINEFIYVVDRAGKKIVAVNIDGVVDRTHSLTKMHLEAQPTHICSDKNILVVAFAHEHRVHQYHNGACVRYNIPEEISISGITYDSVSHLLYVCDAHKNAIHAYRCEGGV